MAVVEHERMAGLELVDAREHRARTRHELVTDVVVNRLSIDGALERRMLEKSLDLRREEESAVLPGVIERLDTEAIARDEELTAGRVPHRESEHAGQPFDARLAPFLVCVQDRLGVAARVEAVARRFELLAQRRVVVD